MVGDLAHICNRGVDKRNIFMDQYDYLRFTNNLFLLNNQTGKIRTKSKNIFANPDIKQERLVEVLKWSLLSNHYHLLLYELVDGGILEYIKRIGNAYTKYFNLKHSRSGYLFQNSARNIRIDNDAQFLYLPFYIDLNPLDLTYHAWRTGPVNSRASVNFLKSYEWSSFKDYYGGGYRLSIVNSDIFYKLFDTSPKKYLADLTDFIKDSSSVKVSTWQVDTSLF